MAATKSQLREEDDCSTLQFRNDDLEWKEFFGSSLSLTNGLISIYDEVSRGIDVIPYVTSPYVTSETAVKSELLNSLNVDNIADNFPSKNYPILKKSHSRHEIRSFNRSDFAVSMDCDDATRPFPKSMILETPGNSNSVAADAAAMDVRNRLGDGADVRYCLSLPHGVSPESDDRKRPLSISSTSSSASSSSSLPRHIRKRITNMSSSSAAMGLATAADASVTNASCEMLSTVAECSPVDAHSLNSCAGGFFENDGSKSVGSVEEIPASDLCRYNSSAADDYLAASDVEESTGSSERNSYICLEGSDSKLLTGVAYTERVVTEILETERNYVKDLEDIVQGYVYQTRNNTELELSASDVDALFGNIETIWQFNRHFLLRLESCGNNPIKISNCFVSEIRGFEIYSTYCTNYPRSMETLMKIMKDEKAAAFLKRLQNVLQHGLPLGSYLLKPVQRILKYHILLQNIFNNHDTSDEGHEVIEKALDSMMNVALHINEMKRQHEHAVRLQEIQCHLCGGDWDGTDLMTLGNLILEERFKVCGAKALRRLFLFEKALLLTKEREDNMLLVKSFIMFSNLMVIESVPKEPLSFQLIPYNAPREQVTLQASSLEQKRFWCHWIKKLMLDNYGPKIPDKAKELVMMLGKSREEEDFESSNLEIPELVKRQHNAPAYLEKRKGRRKSAGFIHDLKLKPRKGLKSGSSSSDTAKLKKDGSKFNSRNSTDVFPATDDEDSFNVSCGDDEEKGANESGCSGSTVYTKENATPNLRICSSQYSDSPADSPATTPRDKTGRDSSFSARSTSTGSSTVVITDADRDGNSQKRSVSASHSVSSLERVPENVVGSSGCSFHRSSSAGGELNRAIKDPLSRGDWGDDDDDAVTKVINWGDGQESGEYQIKWYRSLRKPSNRLGRKSVSGSLGNQLLEEAPSDNSDDGRKMSVKTVAASHSCTKLPSQENIGGPGRLNSLTRSQNVPQNSGTLPKSQNVPKSLDKNSDPWLDVKLGKSMKSNLAKELVMSEVRPSPEDEIEPEDDHLNSVHSALTRLTSRIPAGSVHSLNSCATARTCLSNSDDPAEKFETLSAKDEDRREMRNKLAKILGRSPNGCPRKTRFPSSEGSSPISPSLTEFLKDRHLLIGERMAANPDQTFDSLFTISSRSTHRRTPLSECRQAFNKIHPDFVDVDTGSAENIGENDSPKRHEVKVVRVEPDERDIVSWEDVTSQLFNPNNTGNTGSDSEFYYENKLLEDLEDGSKNGDDDETQSSDDSGHDLSCSPSGNSTAPPPRTAIKETLHSIERRSSARPVRKVEVHLGEKAQCMQEILQTLENSGKNGHKTSTFYSKTVHRTVRDRTRELAVCAAITRVRQNNCGGISIESLTVDEDYLSQVRGRCVSDDGIGDALQPETRTSHL